MPRLVSNASTPCVPTMIAIVLLGLAMWVPAEAAWAGRCEGAAAKPHVASAAKLKAATRCLINKRRDGHGMRRLKHNRSLETAAQRHSRDMDKRNRFSHIGSNGSSPFDRVRRAGYFKGSGQAGVGENIAWGRGRQARPKAVVKAWMHSPAHRQIILEGRFRHVGVGFRNGSPVRGRGRRAGTYTADFGLR